MDEPAACKLKLKGKKRGFKPHTKRKIPNKKKTKKTAKEVDFEPAYAKQRAERCFVPHFAK